MCDEMIKLLLAHSVAVSIFLANIVGALIISYKNRKERLSQNQYQDTKDMLGILLQISQDLETVKTKDHNFFKKSCTKIILGCKKVRHIISRCHRNLPQTVTLCENIDNFLSSPAAMKMEAFSFAKKISDLRFDLNQTIECEWTH